MHQPNHGLSRAGLFCARSPSMLEAAMGRATELNGSEATIGTVFEPLAAPIPEACRISGLSRSEIYRRLGDGSIKAIKSGSRTLVLVESLRLHLATLPAATFRPARAAA
jgi:hypothetical protein